jgi:hypothetical protein
VSVLRLGAHVRIGIVGAGCAGLTAAEELRKKGYQNITVIEGKKRPGGKAMSIPFVSGDGTRRGIYEGGTVFVLPGRIYNEYAKRFGVTTVYNTIPRARTIDVNTGQVSSPFLIQSGLPWYKRAADLFRFIRTVRHFSKIEEPGFDHPDYAQLSEPCSVWFTRHALDFARQAVVPLASALQFPSIGGQIPIAYFIKTAALLDRLSWYRRLAMSFPKFAEGNQMLWQRVAAEHDVRYRSTVRKIVRGKTVRVTTSTEELEFDVLIWAAPLEDFPQVADASPEEADIFGRVRNQKRAVVTCRIDGLPEKVCYFIKNTVDHSVPLAYPYAIYEVSPGSHVYNLYPYMHEDTSMDEIVRNVYHLARRLGGTRAKLLSHPMVWKWFPYFSVEDFRAGIYDRIAKLQGQNHTYFVGELLAGVGVAYGMEYSEHLIAKCFPQPETDNALSEWRQSQRKKMAWQPSLQTDGAAPDVSGMVSALPKLSSMSPVVTSGPLSRLASPDFSDPALPLTALPPVSLNEEYDQPVTPGSLGTRSSRNLRTTPFPGAGSALTKTDPGAFARSEPSPLTRTDPGAMVRGPGQEGRSPTSAPELITRVFGADSKEAEVSAELAKGGSGAAHRDGDGKPKSKP